MADQLTQQVDPNSTLAQLLEALGLGGGPMGLKRRQTAGGAVIPPGAASEAISGPTGQLFPGASLGPFHFMPGTMQQANPWLGMLGESINSGAFQQLLGLLGSRGGAAGAGAGSPSIFGGRGA